MFRGPFHNRGADGLCEACGEPFPCPTGIAIYEAVKREIEHPTPPPPKRHLEPDEPFESVANLGVSFGWGPTTDQPPRPRWEDLEDREHRCPQCLHWWVSHGVPGEDDYGCGVIESSAGERWAMAQLDRDLQRQGVPPEVAGPQAYRDLRYCGCTFAEGNSVTPRQVRIGHDGTSW